MSAIFVIGLVDVGCFPAGFLVMRLMFGKSIMFTFPLQTRLFPIGNLGIGNAIGIIIYWNVNRVLRKPLESAILRLNEAVQNLNAVTQKNSAAEAVAYSGDQLTRVAAQLRQATSFFTLTARNKEEYANTR